MLFAFAFALIAALFPVADPSPTPAGCPSAPPVTASPAAVTRPNASPAPSPCATTLRQIGESVAVGRKTNLIGSAAAASEGTIDQAEIATRPVLRPGEVLEAIPGLVISQHSGEGKANQYYLRGFQLDHGTDLESTIAGIPINMPTHAHGQGYSDINWLMPELVSYVEFKKGTYYADQGDFSTAGAYNLYFRDTIEPVTEFGIGQFGYDRFFTAASPKVGAGRLLYGLELYHDNGSFDKPDEYHKLNAILRYTLDSGGNRFAVNGFAYNGPFDSTDQIPQRLVDEGAIDRYGYVDPTDGGNTHRYAISTQFEHTEKNGTTRFNAYGEDYFLDLFSDFTYYLYDANDYYNTVSNPVTCNPAYTTCTPYARGAHTPNYSTYCPANQMAPAGAAEHSVVPGALTFSCPDQREQLDKRFVAGFDLSQEYDTPGSKTKFGIGLRNDNISTLGLYLTDARNRYPDGTLSNDRVVERASFVYAQSEFRSGKFRIMPGVRADIYNFDVRAFDPKNSGKATSALLSPKLTMAYAFTPNFEAYLDGGDSFHSNDARSVTGVDDPQTHEPYDPNGNPVYQNTPLVRAVGEEVGFRVHQKEITTTVSGWQLLLASELVFDGDHGSVDIGGPTMRRGIEISNYYTPSRNVTIDADFATSTARFLSDPNNLGPFVPESLNAVIAAGATTDTPRYGASLRMRYFGPRYLDQTGGPQSPPSMLFNGQYTYKFDRRNRISLDVFNILNATSDDVTYYYGSWLPQDAANPAYASNPAINPALGAAVSAIGGGTLAGSANGGGVNDYHFHPSEKRTVRLTFFTKL